MKLSTTAAKRAALRASIERFGVLVPRLVDQHGQMFDGHQRTELAAELRKPLPPDSIVTLPDDPEQRVQAILDINDHRRPELTTEQRLEVVADLREKGHSQPAIADAVGVSQSTVRNDLRQLSRGTKFTEPERVTGLDGRSRPATRPSSKPRLSDEDVERRVFDLAGRGLTKTQISRQLYGNSTTTTPRVAAAYARWEMTRVAATADRPRRRTNVASDKTNPKRQRELLEHKRKGDWNQFRRFQMEVVKACDVLETYDIEDFALDDEFSGAIASEILTELLTLQEWLDIQLGSIKTRVDARALDAKIAKLKNTEGRSPEEVATALRLAERLERKRALLAS